MTCSCDRFEIKPVENKWANQYPAYSESIARDATVRTTKTLTLSLHDAPILEAVREIADELDESVVYDEKLEGKKITAEFKDAPIEQVLAMVARRMGSDLVNVAGVWYIGTVRKQDRSVYVTKLPYVEPDRLQQFTQMALSDQGRSATFGDGVVVIVDSLANIDQFRAVQGLLEKVETDQWCMQIIVTSAETSEDATRGWQVTHSFEAATLMSYLSGTGTPGSLTKSMTGALDLSISFLDELQKFKSQYVASPIMLIASGRPASVHSGQSVPIQQTIFDGDTHQTQTNTTYKDVGVKVGASLRERGATRADITIDMDFSSVAGYQNTAPVINTQTVHYDVTVRSGGVYLIGSLDSDTQIKQESGVFSFLKSHRRDSTQLVVFLRAIKIAG